MLKYWTGTPFSRTLLFSILLLVFLSLACGSDVTPSKVGEVSSTAETSTSNTSPETNSANEEPTSASEGLTTYKVGDVITLGDMVMVVLGWSSPEGDDFNKPDDGKKFIVVDVIFVNQGNQSYSISSLLQMELKDGTGQRYNGDLMAAMAADASSPDGELGAGERVRGSVGYQVPQDVTGLQFVFNGDLFSSGKVFVELGEEPSSMEPPAELLGEQEQTAFAVNDVIEVGDLTMIVNSVTYPTGDDFNKPDDGNQFLVVDVTITNNSTESKALSSLLQMSVKDATGQKYDVDLMAQMASGGASPDGELTAGETLRGQVGYQVPQDAQGLIFVFDADIFGSGKVLVNLVTE